MKVGKLRNTIAAVSLAVAALSLVAVNVTAQVPEPAKSTKRTAVAVPGRQTRMVRKPPCGIAPDKRATGVCQTGCKGTGEER